MPIKKNQVKFLYLSMMLLACIVSPAQGTWEKINIPTHHYLKSVYFTDSLYGWVAGDSGTILHTTDGGVSWLMQDCHSFNEVVDVFFLNRNLGWASALNYNTPPYGTVLLKTSNGGDDWVEYPYPVENIFISCIFFRDSLTGWIGGTPHALAKTVNGGLDWQEAMVDTSVLAFFPVLSIQFYNDRYGYASGGMFDIAGVIWRTSDGGSMWYAIDASEAPADEVHGLHIFDSLSVMGAGGDPDFGYGVGMIRTSDGGLHWTYDELDIQGNAYDIDFRNNTEVWAPLGPKQKFIYSLDTGNTWNWITTPDSTAIYDVIFPDSLHGFAVGQKGAMLKYRPRIVPSVPSISAFYEGFMLSQNYPNPFRISTKFKFYVPPPGKNNHLIHDQSDVFLEIGVYNMLGKEEATLTGSNTLTGWHEMEFVTGDLPAGIYFYQLRLISRGEVFQLTPPRKFILMR
jgi:photosystem II stability/assembly factor-like uncharacterized protein